MMKKMTQLIAGALMLCTLLTGCSKISKDNYNRITVGMTQNQVSEILGSPGDKTETEIPGLGLGKLEMWVYNNVGYGGKVIMVSFQNGKVSDKSWSE